MLHSKSSLLGDCQNKEVLPNSQNGPKGLELGLLKIGKMSSLQMNQCFKAIHIVHSEGLASERQNDFFSIH